MLSWFKSWFSRPKPAPFDGPLVHQAELFLAACMAGQIKNFIVVAEATLEDGEPKIVTMGSCSYIWGRTALSTAIAEFPISTH